MHTQTYLVPYSAEDREGRGNGNGCGEAMQDEEDVKVEKCDEEERAEEVRVEDGNRGNGTGKRANREQVKYQIFGEEYAGLTAGMCVCTMLSLSLFSLSFSLSLFLLLSLSLYLSHFLSHAHFLSFVLLLSPLFPSFSRSLSVFLSFSLSCAPACNLCLSPCFLKDIDAAGILRLSIHIQMHIYIHIILYIYI